jgi:hypothetical protein
MKIDDLDEGSKQQQKAIKAMHKAVRGSKAYKMADKLCKDFSNTIPLISQLGGVTFSVSICRYHTTYTLHTLALIFSRLTSYDPV